MTKLTKTNIEKDISRELTIRVIKLGIPKYKIYRILAKLPLSELKQLTKYI